ncbi:MAG: hypothetical protein IKU70_02925 [Clostridia bacterium]|nr:hypothetical protein [Clostridia bacterium]
MMVPKKWGQGALFAFSALDGHSYASDDMTGMLCGDRIGIRFFTQVKRELAIVNVRGKNLEYDAVTSDYIRFAFPEQPAVRIIYAKAHLVIGNVSGVMEPAMFTEGRHKTETVGNVEIHDTMDGDFTALAWFGDRFAFAFAHTREDVLKLAEEGMQMDLDAEEAKKLSFFEKHGLAEDAPHADLYAKTLSCMKTQLYSPEAQFDTIWSTPDRLPHKSLWLWDSVYHAIGHRNIDGKLAEDLIHAIWINQYENGFVPHMANLNVRSAITQPTIIGWGAWKVYQTTGNREFLKECYENNARFLKWCRDNRRSSEKEVYTWQTTDDVLCRCDECGMDNSPRFDTHDPLVAIDFCCFMANDVRHMKLMADELGLAEDAAFYQNWYEQIAKDTNDLLWYEEEGFYFDWNIPKGEMHKVWSVASFLPLFAGICNDHQAVKLVEQLRNPETFGTEFPIPTIARNDATFGSDLWRGPVWINYNYMIAEGLSNCGYKADAKFIVDKTIFHMNRWYQATGVINEFYDSANLVPPAHHNRKGLPFEPYNIDVRMQTIRDYGWSNTLLCDMLAHRA